MTTSKTRDIPSVASFNPDAEIGSTLDDINEETVIINSVKFEERNGRNGKYDLSIITLDDGRIFHTGSPVIAQRLGQVTMFPVRATFSLVKSTNDPRKSYWTVN